jgi:predicted ribosome quality control (RQC) complex YloA/Tae2 family protein
MLSGNLNTFLGYAAGLELMSGDNNIYIGAGVNPTPGPESNTIRIGRGVEVSTIIQGIFGQGVGGVNAPVLVDNGGKLGTVVSSRKFKQNIEGIKGESGRIFDLTPVKFIFKKDETKTPQYGLIAEDVAEVFPELVINDKEGKPFSVRYEVLPILLLNEMQKQQHEMQLQQYEIQKQQHEIQKQQHEMQQQQQKIKTLDNKVEFMSTAFNNLKKQVAKFARN